MKKQTRPKLSESGKARKAEMLGEIQDSMIRLHRSKRQNRNRFLLTASAVIPLTMLAACLYLLGNFETETAKQTAKMTQSSMADHSAASLEKESKSFAANRDVNHSQRVESNLKNTSAPVTSSSTISKYIVRNSDVQRREMELIDDDQLMQLLKQAGVEAWLAEIDEERVVLTESGKRL